MIVKSDIVNRNICSSLEVFLADMLGVPHETTSRACSALIENGLIKINKKRITIINPKKISQFFKTGKYE